LVLEAYSVSHGKATAYLPVIELLKSYFRIELSDDERTRRAKVMGQVLVLDRSLEDILPYLFALLGIEEQPSPLQQMDPQIRRRRTFDALKKLLLRESLNQPVILIFEDLHWIDSETQGFLDVLSESIASAKILLLVNYRPESRHEWGTKTYYIQMRLVPFGKEEAEEFLDELLGIPVGADRRVGPREPGPHRGAPLQSLKQLILDKTEGTPFFMEEIVQELIEQGVLERDGVGARRAVPLPTDLQIPTTVQGVLAARIDRLAPDEKALLQQLAVIGRELPLSLIRFVLPHPEDDLYRLLASLQRKEFLYEQPAFPEVEYLFKHAFTQEVAYNSVLIERRKALHEKTAQAIERLLHERLEEHYDELAHHYSRSGNTEKAIEYLQKAGQQAVRRSANAEAISRFTLALELLKPQPDTLERAQKELALCVALGIPLQATEGIGSREVGEVYSRAQELVQQVGETPQLFPVLRGLWLFHHVRADLPTAYDIGHQLLRLAESESDAALLLEAHEALGLTSLSRARFLSARDHFERGIALYDRHQRRSHAYHYGQDPGVACLRNLANLLWQLGYPDQAQKRNQESLSLARELAHPPTLAYALFSSIGRHFHLREDQIAVEQLEEFLTLAKEQGFSFFLSIGMIDHGYALVLQGRTEEGIEQINQEIIDWQRRGGGVARLWIFSILTKAYERAGRIQEGLTALTEALAFVDKTDEHYHEPELYRLKGELTLQKEFQVQGSKFQVPTPRSLMPNAQAEAEACFLKAIEIARKQQARSLELRAVMSLVRLRQHQASEHGSRNTQYAANSLKHTRCYPISTTGSPKGLTPKTCKRRRRR